MSGGPRPGIILDRDGTLIDVVRDEETGTVGVAWHPSQLRFLPGVLSGLALLARAGFGFAIATNQPGPAKGQFSVAAVERTHRALVAALGASAIELETIEVCFHHPDRNPYGLEELQCACDCRKPEPGLLRRALQKGRFDAERSWMIGDSPADVEAAQRTPLKSGLVFPSGRCELCPLRGVPKPMPDLQAPRFDELARLIVDHALGFG